MVDPIGAKPTNAVDRTVAPVAASRSQRPIKSAIERDTSGIAQTARDFARSAPVDSSRVDQLRSAIRSGNYRIDAQAIADRIMDMREGWGSDDQA